MTVIAALAGKSSPISHRFSDVRVVFEIGKKPVIVRCPSAPASFSVACDFFLKVSSRVEVAGEQLPARFF